MPYPRRNKMNSEKSSERRTNIENLRQRVIKKMNEKEPHDPTVVHLSQKLDRLIIEYSQTIEGVGKMNEPKK